MPQFISILLLHKQSSVLSFIVTIFILLFISIILFIFPTVFLIFLSIFPNREIVREWVTILCVRGMGIGVLLMFVGGSRRLNS